MNGRRRLTTLESISEINLTPMMDLTFILLITFIITFPLIEQGIPVNLPKGQAQALRPEAAESITVDAENRLYLNSMPIALEALRETVTAMGRSNPNVVVMVRADEGIRYAEVVKVLKILHDAGITRTALITQSDGRQ